MKPEELNLTKPLYTINDLLELLPIGRTSLHYAMKCGYLRATKYGSKKIVFTAIDVAEYLTLMRDGKIANAKVSQ